MSDDKDTLQLKKLLCHGNHQFIAGEYDEAWETYDEIINTTIALSHHRRRYLAGAHLGRAAIYAQRSDYDAVDEEIRIASVTYTMDGEQDLGQQIAQLSEHCYIALHEGDTDAIYVVWGAYEHIKWAWVEPEYQSIALLTSKILEKADASFEPKKLESEQPTGFLPKPSSCE